MANSFVRYTGNGSTTTYAIPFSYRDTADLSATVAGVNVTAYTLDAAGTNLTFTTAPSNGAAIEIRRTTSQTTKLVDYVSGSVLTENDLDTDSDQAFFMSQEAIDDANDVISLDNADFQWDTQNKRLKNVADPTAAQDAATKNYLENTWLTPANKTALTTVNANIANINAVNSNEANINSVNSNETNINTVATNIGSVNTVATDITKVIAVANDLAEAVSEVETVADDLNEATSEIDTVASSISNVDTVGTNIANVNTVAGINSDVSTVAGISSDITTVRGINLAISNVSGISNDVTAVNSNSSNINTVAGNNTNVSTVAGISGNVTTVAGISSDVTSVANDATDIGTVAGISSDVTSVAGISSAVSAVNSNSSNINAVNSNSANINTVAGNNTNINTVAGVSSDVTTVAGISSDVQAVENIASNVTTVAGMSTAINTVNSNSSNVNTVAGAITNVNNVGGSIANVNTVATNLASVNAFGETYRIASSAPTTSLNSGDLYFNTSTNVLNVYGASGWQNAGSSVNGTSQRYNYTATNGQTTFTGSDNNSNTLAYDAGYIDVYLNGVKLLNGTDVTVTSGTSVVLASGATTGDVVDIVAYGTFSVASLNADNLDSGTVPDARITGTYTGLTGLDLTDNSKIRLGTGNDLEIYHDGSSSIISDVGTGRLIIRSDGDGVDINKGTSENIAKFRSDAGVELYYDNSKKFETTSAGATITGDLTVDTNTLCVKSSNDRVGIGNGNPQNKLDISALTWDDGILIKNTGNFNVGIIADANRTVAGGGLFNLQGRWDGTEVASVIFQTGSDTTNKDDGEIVFRTASAGTPTERGRITSAGDILIGKTSDAFAGEGLVFSPGSASTITRDDGNVISLRRDTSDGDIIKFYKDTTNVGNIGVAGSNPFLANSSSRGISLGSNLVPCNSSGTAVDNLSDIGTSSARWNDLYLGGGLYVGGTDTAHKLDDYEEGDWTPTIIGASGFDTTITSSYSGTGGAYYTKIGNLVCVTGKFQLGNSSGNVAVNDYVEVGGLPFTTATQVPTPVTEYRYSNSMALTTLMWWTTTSIRAYVRVVNGTPLRNGGSIRIYMTYKV
ncbi:tail fiber protein [Pelagibacter phage HTVC142P]|nr:tail fiber protein [Pelagibacter phage HTVC142P]